MQPLLASKTRRRRVEVAVGQRLLGGGELSEDKIGGRDAAGEWDTRDVGDE